MTGTPRTNAEWEYWGREDPMFGVLTVRGRERGGPNPWTIDEVREQGARYFSEVFEHWQRFGVGSEHCVEIGCGTGRLTRQLIDRFARVTAVDVSTHQLESARILLGPEAERVRLELVTSPSLPLPVSSCDGMFSCEVFQHFDDDQIATAYLRETFRVLKPGGTACFQVPVRGIQRTTALSSRLRNSLLRFARALGRRRMMIYRRYDVTNLLDQLRDIGYDRPQLSVWYNEEHGGFESYVFASKP